MSMEDYWFEADKAIEALETEAGVKVYVLGRSGRHICIDNTFENLEKYASIKELQAKYEQELIDKINGTKTESKEIKTESDAEIERLVKKSIKDGKLPDEIRYKGKKI